MVNELLTSHMFGENGLLRHCRRNASVTQQSPGDGRLLQLSGMDFQSITSHEDPLSVRAKVWRPREFTPRTCLTVRTPENTRLRSSVG